MAAVAVHLDQEAILACEPHPEAVQIGRAQPKLLGAMHDVDPASRPGGEHIGELTGPVG